VVIVIGALVVLTTMLSTVSERRHEIGLFRALGFRKRHIAQIILSEAAVVSLAGGILGWGMGMVSAMVLSSRLVNVTAPVSWNLWLALGAVAGALVVGVVASIYPAVQASNMDPTTALRSL
jgi:putative ABC transport system permease protein